MTRTNSPKIQLSRSRARDLALRSSRIFVRSRAKISYSARVTIIDLTKQASVNQPGEPYKVSREVLRLPRRPRAGFSPRVLLSAVIVSCMFLAGGVILEREIEARALRADDVRTSLIIFGLQVRGMEKRCVCVCVCVYTCGSLAIYPRRNEYVIYHAG